MMEDFVAGNLDMQRNCEANILGDGTGDAGASGVRAALHQRSVDGGQHDVCDRHSEDREKERKRERDR